MPGKYAQPLIEFLAHLFDLFGILGQLFLPPAVAHRAQQGDEAGGRGENHLLAQGFFQQARILVQRRGQELVAGNEQDHEIGRLAEL